MSTHWTRRQFLTRVGAAAAAIQTFDHLDLCCVLAADAKTADKDLFELKPGGGWRLCRHRRAALQGEFQRRGDSDQ